jgi:hypothetical protein
MRVFVRHYQWQSGCATIANGFLPPVGIGGRWNNVAWQRGNVDTWWPGDGTTWRGNAVGAKQTRTHIVLSRGSGYAFASPLRHCIGDHIATLRGTSPLRHCIGDHIATLRGTALHRGSHCHVARNGIASGITLPRCAERHCTGDRIATSRGTALHRGSHCHVARNGIVSGIALPRRRGMQSCGT